MYFEVTLKITRSDERGIDREVKEQFLVENAELWSEVEQKALELYNGECEITAIKISNVIEIVNRKKDGDNALYYKAKLASMFVDNKGKEKTTSYYVLLAAKSVEEANDVVGEYMKQGMEDLILKGINETKLLDII